LIRFICFIHFVNFIGLVNLIWLIGAASLIFCQGLEVSDQAIDLFGFKSVFKTWHALRAIEYERAGGSVHAGIGILEQAIETDEHRGQIGNGGSFRILRNMAERTALEEKIFAALFLTGQVRIRLERRASLGLRQGWRMQKEKPQRENKEKSRDQFVHLVVYPEYTPSKIFGVQFYMPLEDVSRGKQIMNMRGRRGRTREVTSVRDEGLPRQNRINLTYTPNRRKLL
jgi:hypothetical protein